MSIFTHYIYRMPIKMRKLPNKTLYRVYNKNTGKIHAKATTKKNAIKQIRLINMMEHKKK